VLGRLLNVKFSCSKLEYEFIYKFTNCKIALNRAERREKKSCEMSMKPTTTTTTTNTTTTTTTTTTRTT